MALATASSEASSGSSMSLCALPEGIIGKQLASAATRQSKITGPLVSTILVMASSRSAGLSQRMPVAHQLQDRWSAWVQGGALASEMEASTIFVVSRVLGCRAGGIMIYGGTHADLSNLLETAVAGVKLLIERDKE